MRLFSMCMPKRSNTKEEEKPQSSIETTSSNQPSRKHSGKSESSRKASLDLAATGANNDTTNDWSFNLKDSWKSSASSVNSLSSLREQLPETAHVYEFSEIRAATNNLLAKKFSSSSSSASWRCAVRGNDVVVFQRKFRRQIHAQELRDRLSLICKSHHSSLIKLRGASVSGNYIYLVYDYVHGASLADCIRNPKNPNFTVLSNWMSRIQIATDIAHGLDYIHHSTGSNSNFIHNHIKSSSIIVSEPSLNAKICHVGTAELCGEIHREEEEQSGGYRRYDSRVMKFEGTRGYMAPEFQANGVPTQKTDVYALGVVILELLSGKEALKYEVDEEGGGYRRVSVIETAREAAEGEGRVRWWVDKRLKDSYPVEVAGRVLRVGLECVEEDPERRPDMTWVAGRVSKLYLESKDWAEKMGVPTDFTVTLVPR
ncbi:lysM domain receptor-like kinase 3 [Rhododendron vialii]|uniref:lysM domain receptor-like kinase 3 n=1 Tax=Rhododendron vialii TaxID=182163 RepID=UPI00265FBD23|nr:lysM domain receptor-like kinase 3 [Rhododendron vialii]